MYMMLKCGIDRESTCVSACTCWKLCNNTLDKCTYNTHVAACCEEELPLEETANNNINCSS